MLTGLVLIDAWALWTLRGDSEENDALRGRGVLGLLLGLAVAVTVRAVLLLLLRRGRTPHPRPWAAWAFITK
jgi:hypothetical protein